MRHVVHGFALVAGRKQAGNRARIRFAPHLLQDALDTRAELRVSGRVQTQRFHAARFLRLAHAGEQRRRTEALAKESRPVALALVFGGKESRSDIGQELAQRPFAAQVTNQGWRIVVRGSHNVEPGLARAA